MSDHLAPLKAAYAAIAAFTRPFCMRQCGRGICCAPRYCDLAERRAAEFGLSLPRQAHPSLKYMGEEGCIVPPYLRPLCAVHVCEYELHLNPGFGRGYRSLREKVVALEQKLGPSWPIDMDPDYWD